MSLFLMIVDILWIFIDMPGNLNIERQILMSLRSPIIFASISVF